MNRWSEPAFRHLAEDGRGLPAVQDFFAALIHERCSGEHAGWGCMLVNASIGAEGTDPAVRELLEENHRQLRDAMCTALGAARRRGQLPAGTSPGDTAEVLALLVYGVNLRSRAGADAGTLHRAVSAALAPLRPDGPGSA